MTAHPRGADVDLGGWVDPASVHDVLLRSADVSFWLDSGPDATAGVSWMGAPAPGADLVTSGRSDGSAVSATLSTRDLLDRVAGGGTDGDALGWVGWLGYEAGSRLVGAPAHPSPWPDAAFMPVDRVLRFDHAARTLTARVLRPDAPDVRDWLGRMRDALHLVGERPHRQEPLTPGAVPPARSRHTRERYLDLVERCREHIRAGDAYVVCLTDEITVDGVHDHPADVYARLRRANPAHHGALLRWGDVSLLSSSPETFLTADAGGRVVTRPIKGTRPRGADPESDRRLADELARDEKERAENLMIVDLVRNDLSRVAEPGSVRVESLHVVETYATVHQLVSSVSGRLSPDRTLADAIAALFPGGSMTGAPKHSAMTIIDALEAGPRGLYSGAFGHVGLDGGADLAMTIRSIVLDGQHASIGTGGGITASSDPAAEHAETRVKAAALLGALGAHLD